MSGDDDRYFVVGGRRWRRTDPAIPEKFRAELVAELMDARRAIGAGDRSPAARARVNDAKVALGERGNPWWDDPTNEDRRARIRATMRALLRRRSGKSICPSDVARAIGGRSCRDLMDEVRSVAAEESTAGRLSVRQKGEAVDPTTAKGPVRYLLQD